MHSLEVELRVLQADGALPGPEADRLGALEAGRLFSVRRELLVGLYACVTAIVGGVGILVQRNLDRIGPVTLLAAIIVAALACYATAIRTQRLGRERSLPGDYLLLLGALLASTALGYAEYQFRLLDSQWSWHLLVLAILHGLTAYWFNSTLVLSVALTSFAGWLGLAFTPGDVSSLDRALAGTGERALACATAFTIGRAAHRGLHGRPDFLPVYEHFAANLAFLGALILVHDPATTGLGLALLIGLAVGIGRYGFHQGRELFVLYAVGYGTYGICVLEDRLTHSGTIAAVMYLVTIVAAVALLTRLRTRMRDAPT